MAATTLQGDRCLRIGHDSQGHRCRPFFKRERRRLVGNARSSRRGHGRLNPRIQLYQHQEL